MGKGGNPTAAKVAAKSSSTVGDKEVLIDGILYDTTDFRHPGERRCDSRTPAASHGVIGCMCRKLAYVRSRAPRAVLAAGGRRGRGRRRGGWVWEQACDAVGPHA